MLDNWEKEKAFCAQCVGFRERTCLLDVAANRVFVRSSDAENGEDEPANRRRFPPTPL